MFYVFDIMRIALAQVNLPVIHWSFFLVRQLIYIRIPEGLIYHAQPRKQFSKLHSDSIHEKERPKIWYL